MDEPETPRGRLAPQNTRSRVGKISALASAVLTLSIPSVAWAQPFDCGYGYHMRMWGGLAGLAGLLVFFILVVVAMVLALLVARWLGSLGQRKTTRSTPLDILKERFARGEIDRQEFEERRQLLGE